MMGFGMMVGMLVFWALIIVLAVLLVKELFNSNSNRSRDNVHRASQILDERYARGEISQEQYLTMLKDIN
ncbi:MAG: SHOCT domain-containing protein [Anaerolineaceae bacterium]|jgi:putative membrane protein|nr:SHOCT domain-containing protein [Anaerolineaceae bacterium]